MISEKIIILDLYTQIPMKKWDIVLHKDQEHEERKEWIYSHNNWWDYVICRGDEKRYKEWKSYQSWKAKYCKLLDNKTQHYAG